MTSALRRRYGRASGADFNKYRDLAVDVAAGSPLQQWGEVHRHLVGDYWTVPVDVPLAELSGLRAVVQDRKRLTSVRRAIEGGAVLPPIEIGVSRSGGGWLVDGNHRLVEARKSGRATISARFTFTRAA